MVSNEITIHGDGCEWKIFASTYTVTDMEVYIKQQKEYL